MTGLFAAAEEGAGDAYVKRSGVLHAGEAANVNGGERVGIAGGRGGVKEKLRPII